MPEGRIIPKDILEDILERSESIVSFPTLTPESELKLIMEDSKTIKETFRPANKVSTFHKLHPKAVGVVKISLPGYSKDGNLAGIYFYRLRVGLGGGGYFVMLRRTKNSWQIEWSHNVWIE